ALIVIVVKCAQRTFLEPTRARWGDQMGGQEEGPRQRSVEEARAALLKILDQLSWRPKQLADAAAINHSILYRALGSPKRGHKPTSRLSLGSAMRICRVLENAGADSLLLRTFKEGQGLSELLGPESMTSTSSRIGEKSTGGEPQQQEDETQARPAHRRTVQELLDEAESLISKYDLLGIEQKALEALQQCRHGSEKWAEITLRYCAYSRQQAGDVVEAERYIRSVEKNYLEVVGRPSPLIEAWVKNRRGWIADEQDGYFATADELFAQSLPLVREADDLLLLEEYHHFRLRIASERAMTKAKAWIGARGAVPADLIEPLWKALRAYWPVAMKLSPANPHHYNRKFMVLALINPGEALKQLIPEPFEEIGLEHVRTLSQARWHVSNEDWATAAGLAKNAFSGYSRSHFPQGLAHAATVWAYCLANDRAVRTMQQYYLCLDLWILALLLHPYDIHPLWRKSLFELNATLKQLADRGTTLGWLRSYFADLDHRVREREGVFKALDNVLAPWFFPPSVYLKPFLTADVRSRL
ncbi:MAG: hypothetical protein M1358_11025, partial [Chloroflexi bacterium]|nr:hypothetical protein [Chloroflexota bacterium]